MPHSAHKSPADFDALDQLRMRHELLKQALMAVERKLKAGKQGAAYDCLDIIRTALSNDKKV